MSKEEIELKLKELKSQAYDFIATRDAYQEQLNSVNAQILDLMKKLQSLDAKPE